MPLTAEKQELFDNIVADLMRIEIVVAVVMGGSHATGYAMHIRTGISAFIIMRRGRSMLSRSAL